MDPEMPGSDADNPNQGIKDAQDEKAALMGQDFSRLLSFPAVPTRKDYVLFLSTAASRGALDPSFLEFLEDFVVDGASTPSTYSLARSRRLHLAFVTEYARGCTMAMRKEPPLPLDAPAPNAATSWPILPWADAFKAIHPDVPSRQQQPRKQDKDKGGRPTPPAEASDGALAPAPRAAPPPDGGQAPRPSQT